MLNFRYTSGLALLSSRQGRAVSLTTVLIVAAWFALPVLFMAYTEGFQAQVAINANTLHLGDPGSGDSLYLFNSFFFLLTRLGTTLGLAAMQAGGLASLTAFWLTGVIGMVLLIGILLMFLWQTFRVGLTLGLLCCLLFPTVFESAYIPNDDLPSAVLVCLAVLVFWCRPTLLGTTITGMLLGFAALLRLDAVLVAPAFAILLLTEVPGWVARALRACIAAVLVVGIPVVAYRLNGLSFLDTFPTVERALHLWDRSNRILHNDLRTLLFSVPAAGGLAWALGVLLFARTRRWRDLGLAVFVPLLYVAGYRNQLVEGRYLLPLAPFVLMTIAEGLRSIATATTRWRTLMLTGFAVCLALWIAPLPSLMNRLIGEGDGPRFVVGRAWNPLATLWWQDRLNAGQAALEAAIERVSASPDPVLVTGFWNGDRLATLLLLEHGFALRPALTPPACRSIAETLVRGQTVLLQIRTHIPFLPHTNERLTWEEVGMPGLRQARPAITQVLFVGSGLFNALSMTLDGPGVAFSAAHGPSPPLAPGLLAVLPGGVSVADIPVNAVAASLGVSVSGEDRAMALDTLARRAELLR